MYNVSDNESEQADYLSLSSIHINSQARNTQSLSSFVLRDVNSPLIEDRIHEAN